MRLCTLDGDLCIGCGRTIDEIMEWTVATRERRHAIVAAAAVRREARPRS